MTPNWVSRKNISIIEVYAHGSKEGKPRRPTAKKFQMKIDSRKTQLP